VLLFRQGSRSRWNANRHWRAAGLSVVWRNRLAGCRIQDDASRLLGAADSFSQLSDSVARIAGKGPRDRGAAHEVPAPVAADGCAVRRTAAAGAPRCGAGIASGDLPSTDASD